MLRVLLYHKATHFLQHILNLEEARSSYVNLIICCEQSIFTASLMGLLGDETAQNREQSPLLSNTLDTIARSQNIGLAFCPTLTHVMAYLATYCSRPTVLSEPLRSNGVIAILNPLTPFAAGSGFSAQRVCKIFSVAVQVAYNEGKRLIMCQCESIRSSDGIIPGSESWSISIPLFASPPNTLEKGDSAKRVKLECIAKRWFKFHKPIDEGQSND